MPEAAKPKPPAASPHGFVQSAGKQEDFIDAAVKLGESLGWKGDPDWVSNDIAVADAHGYLAKTMHEHFIAGAKGEEQPDHLAACEHLAVEDDEEQSAIETALKAAYESGAGAAVTLHPIIHGDLGRAATTMQISKVLDAAEAAGKVG